MYIFFIFSIMIYLNVETDSRDIEVLNSGLTKLEANDMVVLFFVTIHNHGVRARNVMATMVECCEKITEDDTDCDIIELYGEHLGILHPGVTRNVTFLYPNVYGYNRKGYCIVDIWNHGDEVRDDENNEIRHKIDFDTSIRLAPEEIPSFLRSFKMEKLSHCDTTDLDPFDGCNPVDCRLKYSGFRNYFNRKRKRCQKVPICLGDPSKDLPDVVYVPMSNTCRNLEKLVTQNDINGLVQNKCDNPDKAEVEAEMVNIQCHHGEIDVRTGLCICDKGWTSEAFDPDTYNEGASMYHMCDKKCHPEVPARNGYMPFVLGVILALWVLFLVVLCEKCCYFCDYCRRPQEADEEEICYFPVSGTNY